MARKTAEEKARDKEIARLQREEMERNRENKAALKRKRKELLKERKRQEQILERRAKKKDISEEEKNRVVWIDSTQMCVPIDDVIDSIIITSDKRYLKLIEIQPNNFGSLPIRKQNAVGDMFASMLSIVPAQIQFKCFSRRGDITKLLERMKNDFSAETNENLVRMQEDYLNLVRQTATTIAVTRRFFAIIEYQHTNGMSGAFEDIASSLETIAAMLKSTLRECGNTILDTGDTTAGVDSILYEFLNRRASENIPFEVHADRVFSAYDSAEAPLDENGEPSSPMVTANELIAPQWMDFTHPRYCVVDDKYYRFFYIDSTSYTSTVATGWLNTFIGFGAGIDVDIYIKHIPVDQVKEKIARNQRLNVAKKDSGNSDDSYAMQDRIQAATYLLSGIASRQDYFEFSIMVTACADSLEELNGLTNILLRESKMRGYKLRDCMFFEEQAFYASLPLCNCDKIVWKKGWRNVLTEGAASLYPFLSFELQDPGGIVMGTNTHNNSLVIVNLFYTLMHPNANLTIVGRAGYGKTFTSQLLAIRQRLQGVQVFVITPMSGREDYYRVCQKIQGQFVPMGPGTKFHINVFDIRKADNDVDLGDSTKTLLSQKLIALHSFFRLIVRDMTLEEENLLDGKLTQVYSDFGITDDDDSIFEPGTQTYKKFPRMQDVYNLIKDDDDLRRVAHIIRPYVDGGHKEYNQYTNVDLSNKYIVFDLDGLDGNDLAVALFVCMDFVWGKAKENKVDKKAIFIDEIWKLIGVEGNDKAAEYCVEIYKTIRKYGGSACCMTQELTDFFKLKDGKYGKAIVSNSDTKVCLRVDEAEVSKLREVMELSEAEIEQIPKLPRGTGLLVTGSSRVQVQFRASPKEFEVLTTDPEVARREAAERARRLKALKEMQKQKEEEEGT